MSNLGKRINEDGGVENRSGGMCMYICKQICQAHGEMSCACPSYHPDYVTLQANSKGSYVSAAFNRNFGTDTY